MVRGDLDDGGWTEKFVVDGAVVAPGDGWRAVRVARKDNLDICPIRGYISYNRFSTGRERCVLGSGIRDQGSGISTGCGEWRRTWDFENATRLRKNVYFCFGEKDN
jgi:hypothetical protein